VHVVATAGHVDHGKSTLVRALTGMEPDRWAEERRRGLTIDLGFAWTTLPSGREIAFVDVPGHQRFMGNGRWRARISVQIPLGCLRMSRHGLHRGVVGKVDVLEAPRPPHSWTVRYVQHLAMPDSGRARLVTQWN